MKKFIFGTVFGIILIFILYFFIKRYDVDGNVINWILMHKFYIIFLFLSILFIFITYGDEGLRIKFISNFLIFTNCVYLLFLITIGSSGINSYLGIFLLGFLSLLFLGIFIKKGLGYFMVGLSVVGIFIVLFLGYVPLFDEGIDFHGFEKEFKEQLLIYSDTAIYKDNAFIEKDEKIYEIPGGLVSHDLKIGKKGSKIVFKSDMLYPQTYCFIIYPGGNFVELPPQSAISVTENFEIEIITGDVKYYQNNKNGIVFTGTNLAILETGDSVINLVENWYKDRLILYANNQFGSKLIQNKTILKISKNTIELLSKIFPGKYKKNLINFHDYIDVFGINIQENTKGDSKMTTKGVMNNIRVGIKKGFENINYLQ